jgi:hypothetical protein
VTLHSRAHLRLRPPTRQAPTIRPEGITVHYGGLSPWPSRDPRNWDHNRCASIWRAWQAFHLDDRNWADIAYSSGVCGHGDRYEGRGPGRRTAAQGTNDGNTRSLAVVYLGGEGDPLTGEAKAAFHLEAQRFGVPLRWVHSDWRQTGCPGAVLSEWKRQGFPSPAGVEPVKPGPRELTVLDHAQQANMRAQAAHETAARVEKQLEATDLRVQAIHETVLRLEGVSADQAGR